MKKQIALVTGASRGIGHEIAKALVREGYEVYGTSRHPDTLSEDEKIPGVKFLYLDLLKPETIDRVVTQFDSLDLLVNNAGFSQFGTVEEISMDSIQQIFAANLFSQIRLIKGFIPNMRKERSGTIVNISSMAGSNPVPFSSIYGAVKGALNKFSQGLRHELAKYNVKVFAVAPLFAKTSIFQTQDYDENSPYIEDILKAKQSRIEQMKKSVHPKMMAKQLMGILKKKNPKYHYTVGKNAKLMGFLLHHMPQKVIEKICRKKFWLDY
jgi:short-subunit dehydrogenase